MAIAARPPAGLGIVAGVVHLRTAVFKRLRGVTRFATGTGEAQAELTQPLIVYETKTVDFGTIAVDPASGAQTVSINNLGVITCPASYVCSGTPAAGSVTAAGANSTMVHADIPLRKER